MNLRKPTKLSSRPSVRAPALTGAVALLSVVSACTCPPEPSTAPTAAPASTPATVAAAPAPAAPTPAGAPKKCTTPLAPVADGLIDDLEDNNALLSPLGGRDAAWYVSKDDKGTTLLPPEGDIKPTAGGANGSKYAMRFHGKLAKAEGAWGANFGVRFKSTGSYDASKYAGISFFAKTAKGSTQTFRLKLADASTHPDGGSCKDCWNHFGRDISVSEQWTEYKLSFDELSQQEYWGDPRPPKITVSKLFGVEFSASPAGSDFDVMIDDVKFLDCP